MVQMYFSVSIFNPDVIDPEDVGYIDIKGQLWG